MRNQRIDLLKCAGIYSVVFLHIKSGLWDWTTTCLTRFAVPLFFLVAGYYAYGQREDKLLRRARHTFLLWLTGVCVVVALGAGMALRDQSSCVWSALWRQATLGSCRNLLICQTLPFAYSYHLWFIGSMPLLYLIWWGITRLFHRLDREIPCRPLAVAAVLLLGVHLLLQEGLAMLGWEVPPAKYLRNAWMDGLPFFLLGAWMHRDEEKIVSALSGEMVLWGIGIGTGMALMEQAMAGYRDLFAGVVLSALLLMAAALKWPEVRQSRVRRWMCFCGSSLTFVIYVVHVPLYGLFYEWRHVPAFGWIVGHPMAASLVTAGLSTAISLLVYWGKRAAGRLVKRGERRTAAPY